MGSYFITEVSRMEKAKIEAIMRIKCLNNFSCFILEARKPRPRVSIIFFKLTPNYVGKFVLVVFYYISQI